MISRSQSRSSNRQQKSTKPNTQPHQLCTPLFRLVSVWLGRATRAINNAQHTSHNTHPLPPAHITFTYVCPRVCRSAKGRGARHRSTNHPAVHNAPGHSKHGPPRGARCTLVYSHRNSARSVDGARFREYPLGTIPPAHSNSGTSVMSSTAASKNSNAQSARGRAATTRTNFIIHARAHFNISERSIDEVCKKRKSSKSRWSVRMIDTTDTSHGHTWHRWVVL